MFAFFAPLSFFCSCVAFFAFSLAPLLYPQLYLTVSMHSTQQHQRGLLLSLYLSPTTKAAAVVCNYDLQHGPPWLLLLSFIVNRLLIVYHAVLLLCHSYHPAHAFVWIDEHNIVHEVFQIHLWRPVPFLFCVSFFFISSDLAHRAPITTSVAVRLFAPDRDSCVLASSCGLPLVLLQWSISQFSLRIRTSIVAAYFFI